MTTVIDKIAMINFSFIGLLAVGWGIALMFIHIPVWVVLLTLVCTFLVSSYCAARIKMISSKKIYHHAKSLSVALISLPFVLMVAQLFALFVVLNSSIGEWKNTSSYVQMLTLGPMAITALACNCLVVRKK